MISPFGILNDTTLCNGCGRCVEACKRENRLAKDLPRRWKRSIDDISSTRFTTVVQWEKTHYVRRFCRHCVHPACVSACIVGALHKTAEGPVLYDSSKCIGCRYCMIACPYSIPRYDWESRTPYIRKCTMCHDRIYSGQMPACVDACLEKATIFGSRDAMIQEAHRRITENPGRYLHAVVGESEVGGTSVIYISDIALTFLTYKPDLGTQPLPELTWSAISKVPALVLGVGGLMSGLYWMIERRNKLSAGTASGSTTEERKDNER